MSIFDQMKAAGEMMKNMSPEEIKKMMEQAKESQRMLQEIVQKMVKEEIEKRDLVSRSEVEKMLNK